MKIVVDRDLASDNATLSRIFVDGKFICHGLEDEKRTVKVPGETRIPAGEYKVTLRTFGAHHLKYQKRFPNLHRGMLWVRDVPGFSDILIHIGNTERDTAGCLLVGLGRNEETMTLSNSTVAYANLYNEVVDAAAAGNLTIEYQDNE